ncbi:hypothetical protein AYO20_05553 [Fonsecaea nubica]|uniref:Clr5 domain-containing protein n=1 Tax=Fonsecaea nubica TaxID=856822 RepID=A0A178D024_9EURO|nr:hypothetical protein AYO20_05553 [Fonsecaea nubica]OAL35076.1 hypothetical protein AYO20_05553 [Fonsecaea nubica]
MALSLGNPHGWTVENVAQPPPVTTTSTQAPASSTHLEAREGPAPAQWQAVKEEIRILYEKHPLRDVRKILLDRHNFRATHSRVQIVPCIVTDFRSRNKSRERMYKARLSQWGISKNYSDKDYQICAVLHHTRQKSGKRLTAFVIHGHKRSLKDLHKYIKGRKMTEEDFLASALANADQQQEQYPHVRAYTPEPETEAEEGPPLHHQTSSAPTRARPPEIAANVPLTKDLPSPREAVSESVSSVPAPASRSTAPHSSAVAHQHSPTTRSPSSHRWSPHHAASPYFPLTVSPPQRHGPYFPSKDSTTNTNYSSDASPSSSRARTVSSPQDAPLSAALSYTYLAPHEPLATIEDQVRHAGTLYDTSPLMSCNQLGRDVEYMALQMVDAPSLKSLCGHDDIRSWSLLFNDSSSEDSMDYEQICPTCHESTREHFISLPNLEMPQLPRNILNASQDSSAASTMSVPASSRGHEHSWKWVARCFAACIYLRRGDHTLSQRSLADADAEFKQMLVPRQDPKVLLALNQTLQILQMHDQGDITKTIMQSAYLVAERSLGPSHPITTIVRWMVYVANGQMRNCDITSDTLGEVYEEMVQRYGPEDSRSIASQYCHGFMLNVERKLQEAEQVLRQVYKISSTVLGPKHLQSISALTNLHRALERQNRLDEAIAVLRCAVRDSQDTLGDNHPRRLESLRLLALLYQRKGYLDLTEELYWQVVDGRVKMLGKNHTFTQGMKRDLEQFLQERGKWTIEQKIIKPDGSVEVVASESSSQLRLQDLFEWDAHEQWDDTRSEGESETGSEHAAF